MNTFDLIGTDDGILEGRTVLEDENCVRVASFVLSSAADTAAVGLQATVETARDLFSSIIGDGALGRRDGEVGALVEQALSSSRGSESQDGGSDGSLHFGIGWNWEDVGWELSGFLKKKEKKVIEVNVLRQAK